MRNAKNLMLAGAVLALCSGVALADAIGQTPVGMTPVGQPPVIVSVGTWAGDVLSYTVAAFGAVISGFVVKLLVALARKAGVEVTDQMRARLGDIILNGLNLGAKEAAEKLDGKDPIAVRNVAIARAITYTQAHGAETIKALGLDPTSGEAIEAIRARAETMIADPNTPTPGIPSTPVSKPTVS